MTRNKKNPTVTTQPEGRLGAWMNLIVCGLLSWGGSFWHAENTVVGKIGGQPIYASFYLALLVATSPIVCAAFGSHNIANGHGGLLKRIAIYGVFVCGMAMSIKAQADAVESILGPYLCWAYPVMLDVSTFIALDTIMQWKRRLAEAQATPAVAGLTANGEPLVRETASETLLETLPEGGSREARKGVPNPVPEGGNEEASEGGYESARKGVPGRGSRDRSEGGYETPSEGGSGRGSRKPREGGSRKGSEGGSRKAKPNPRAATDEDLLPFVAEIVDAYEGDGEISVTHLHDQLRKRDLGMRRERAKRLLDLYNGTSEDAVQDTDGPVFGIVDGRG